MKFLRLYVYSAIVLIMVYSCTFQNEEELFPQPLDLKISLKWFEGSFNQTETEMRTGLAWALSSLGAELPKGSLDRAIVNLEDRVFILDLSKVGFNDKAERALYVIMNVLKNSQAYQNNGHMELGRFIMLTLNSSFHYYKITGVPETLSEFSSMYKFEGKRLRVINSSISKVQRLIEIAEVVDFSDIAYFSSEGLGTFQDNTFDPEEFETMDFMSNGQLRFGLYDKNGKLKQVANSDITLAGKPAKCLWCHETTIQPFFRQEPVFDGSGYLSEQGFLNLRLAQLEIVASYRETLNGDINFEKRQDHALMEHIYIDFMEPSSERIAEEWNLSEDEVENLLAPFSTHPNEEFDIEGLYHRSSIDELSPLSVIKVPESAREYSEIEPNFF